MKVNDAPAAGLVVITGRLGSGRNLRQPLILEPRRSGAQRRWNSPMEIREVFYPLDRAAWRSWLQIHGSSAAEIWVCRFRKATGIKCIDCADLVEECLCFGWIDGLIKKYDDESNVQRITPRNRKTFLSELNRQRVLKLEALGLMTDAGREPIADQIGSPYDPWEIPDWIEGRLREDSSVGENLSNFPFLYRRLKIGWITEAGQRRPEEMEKRLAYLIKDTRAGKMYGTTPIRDEALLDGLRSERESPGLQRVTRYSEPRGPDSDTAASFGWPSEQCNRHHRRRMYTSESP